MGSGFCHVARHAALDHDHRTGERRGHPQYSVLALGIETSPKAADAANDNAKATAAVVADIKAEGIDARDIALSASPSNPFTTRRRTQTGASSTDFARLSGAQRSQRQVRRIDKAGALAQQWIAKGANAFGGVEFDYDQKEAKYDALRGDAVRDALRKATSYTNGLQIRLGRVLSIVSPGDVIPAPAARRR